MIKIFGRKEKSEAKPVVSDEPKKVLEQPVENKPQGLFSRLKQGLQKTRQAFTSNLGTLLLGKKIIDQQLLEEIETHLLTADIGVEVTQTLIKQLTQQVARKQLKDGDALFQALKNQLERLLLPVESPLHIDASESPFVILMIGVNGSGKTTTIGKLAKQFQSLGKRVMLAAGDTFRAAAIDQLKVWGQRNNAPVIAQQPGSDSASVIFDASIAAKARGIDILIADTAGRLHTQTHLMDELKKIKRVISKHDTTAPHEVMLVIDASLGQNALRQAKQFHEAIGVTGLTLTKLDGTAKGGIIFAIANELKIPIRFIGIGEAVDDLKPFKADEFVRALFE